MPTENYDLRNNLTTMMYSGQSANLRKDLTYTARDQQSFLTCYSNLAATVTVGTTSMGYDAVGRLTNLGKAKRGKRKGVIVLFHEDLPACPRKIMTCATT